MMIEKVKGPDKTGRDAMYFAAGQETAYRLGAYDYLGSIAMLPRLATIAAYVQRLGLRSVLDLGCGTGELLGCLPPDVAYVGVDLSETAIRQAQERFASRPGAHFYCADFRAWEAPPEAFDAVVWAGIGCSWTCQGRGGSAEDWLQILALAEPHVRPGGCLIFELVTQHWPSLERLIEGRYHYEAGCDLDCFQSSESPRRSVRVFRRNELPPLPVTLGHPGSSLVPAHLARELIACADRMGQATDPDTANLGFGYVYYGLVRLCRPEVVVSVGSYRGFAPLCLTLGLVDNGTGTCYFIDPGKVDGYWHDPGNAEHLRQRFRLGERWRHLKMTSQQALAGGGLPATIDLLLIDGDHSYEGVRHDFERLGERVRPGGFILLHDATVEGRGFTPWEVKAFLEAEVYGHPGYEVLTLPFSAGLAVVRRR